jgi:hypothetical protein
MRKKQASISIVSEPEADPEADPCLHCQINDLLQERMEGGQADLAELASMIVESLAELILLAPEDQRALLMADALAHFGHVMLDKSGASQGEGSSARH